MKLQGILSLAAAALVSLAGIAHAQYRWVDADGRVHYSNFRPVSPAPPATPEPPKSPEPREPAAEPVKPPASARALIEEVLELSGAKRQLAQIPAMVQAQMARRKAEMKPQDFQRASQLITESYRGEALYQAVFETFKRRYDEPRLTVVAQALRSPLFKRIMQLEMETSTPEATEAVRAYAARLNSLPPSPARQALIRRVDEATGATESNVDVLLATVRGIVTALDPMVPASRRLKPGDLERKLEEVKAKAQTAIKNEVLLTMLYAYEPLSDGELRDYIAFLESDTGRWFSRVSREAMLGAMTAAAQQVGSRLGKTFSAAPSATPAAPAAVKSGASLEAVPGRPSLPRATSLSAQQNWALAASAILTEGNGQRHDLLGGMERAEPNVTQWKQLLRDRWGIGGRADLFMVLKWLEEGGDRQDFERLAEFSRSLSPAQRQEMRQRLSDNDRGLYQLMLVGKNAEKLGRKSLLGWDYIRYITLCRWGYLVGYLREEEAWARILPAARTLRSTFDSWQDLGDNYLLGRAFTSFEQDGKDGQQLYRATYQKLLSDPGSPWKQNPWETNLDTTSVQPPAPHSVRAAAGVSTR